MNIPSTRLAEIQDVAMGTSQAPKLTPVEEQQLVGEVLFLRANARHLSARLGPLEAANTAWAAANAELRAYKERTEAGLHKLSGMVDHCGDVTEDEMRVHGLWRDPPQAEVQP